MLRLVAGRLLSGVVVVLLVASFAFWMLKAAPGGPFDEERALQPEIKRNIEKRYHLDWPLWQQYTHYITGLVPFARGQGLAPDLGHSMKRTESVWEIIAGHVTASATLGLLALSFATVFGVGLGLLAAYKHNRWIDNAAMSVALFGISIPSIVLGPLLIMFFSLTLMWLPPARFDSFKSMILPALTLGLIYMGVIARLARSGMLETLRQDYVRTARAKGLSEATVIFKHALRLGIIPVVSYLGPAIAGLITGSFVVEKIFQIPGLGYSFVSSIADRDYPVLAGILVFYATFLVILNFLVDVAYAILDPRLRGTR